MFTKLNSIIKEQPIIALVAAFVIGIGLTKIVQADPLAEKPIVKYRVVYEHTSKLDVNCGGENGSFWWTQELNEGVFFDEWEGSGYCSEHESQALSQAETLIKERIETSNSKSRVYQAWATKEDSVRFEPLPEVK